VGRPKGIVVGVDAACAARGAREIIGTAVIVVMSRAVLRRPRVKRCAIV